MNMNKQDIRPAVYAGSWYEGNPDRLRTAIETYMDNAKITLDLGKIIGIISPHAGHIYSGHVAGYAYKHIIGKSYDTVVVIAPNHADPRLNFTSVYAKGGYETPLGIIPVDIETAKAIVEYNSSDEIRESDYGHLSGYGGRMEHSLEIQLPFLQVALGDFKLVSIVMGNQDGGRTSCAALGNAIASAVKGKNALLVASTDLSHFHDIETLKKMDSIVSEHISEYDPDALLRDISSGKCEACGALPTVSVMIACSQLGATKGVVLKMANSGDVSGDYDGAVGYLSAVLTSADQSGNNDESMENEKKVGVDLGLSEEEKGVLRTVVKTTLENVVNGGSIPAFDNFSGKLGEEWGAFVTLNKKGQLRGCIGHIVGDKPLISTVAEMTMAAALQDPRFPKVSPAELKDIDFEISVLTPIRRIKDIEEIVVGRDGIIITQKWNRGLLLPQVATDYGWDRITFLEHTCNKAGLPKDAWKDKDTIIEIFSAEVFK
ncbi:AmmeMemoRadiSam system protein B [Candidatus Latescibacterota bacterium]